MKSPKSGFIYISHNISYDFFDSNIFKIGRTSNPKARLTNLSTSQVYNSTFKYISNECTDILLCDKLIKIMFKKYVINREIYQIDINCDINMINKIIKQVNQRSNKLINSDEETQLFARIVIIYFIIVLSYSIRQ